MEPEPEPEPEPNVDISAYFQVRSHYRKMPILARLNAKIAVLNWRAVLSY